MKRFPSVNLVQTYGQTGGPPALPFLKACDASAQGRVGGRTILGVELSVNLTH